MKLGLKVKIKSWDFLCSKYKLDQDGDVIVTNEHGVSVCCIVKPMAIYCDTVQTISHIKNFGNSNEEVFYFKNTETYFWPKESFDLLDETLITEIKIKKELGI